jgi:hypothetical protein
MAETDLLEARMAQLALAIRLALPIRLLYFERKGGASDEDYARMPNVAEKLASCGTSLMWRDADGVLSSEMFRDLVYALAVASVPPIGGTEQQKQMAQFRYAQILGWLDEMEGKKTIE